MLRGLGTTQGKKHMRLAASSPTHSVCMTCWAMCLNGVRIGQAIATIRTLIVSLTHLGHRQGQSKKAEVSHAGCCAVVIGVSPTSTAYRGAATQLIAIIATNASASVLQGLHSRVQVTIYSLYFLIKFLSNQIKLLVSTRVLAIIINSKSGSASRRNHKASCKIWIFFLKCFKIKIYFVFTFPSTNIFYPLSFSA